MFCGKFMLKDNSNSSVSAVFYVKVKMLKKKNYRWYKEYYSKGDVVTIPRISNEDGSNGFKLNTMALIK